MTNDLDALWDELRKATREEIEQRLATAGVQAQYAPSHRMRAYHARRAAVMRDYLEREGEK